MLIEATPDLLVIGRTIRTEFQNALGITPTWRDRLATTIPSTNKQNTYAWLENLATVREWVGPRVYNSLKAHDYTIVNKPWEFTIELNRDQVEDSDIGMVPFTAQSQGEAFAKHPDKLIAGLLINGASTLCYDGQNFYDTDHPVNDGVVSNYEATSFGLTLDNVMTARARMLSITNEAGDILASNPRLLVVPPQLEKAARQISSSALALQTTGTSFAAVNNVGQGLFDVLVVPEIASQATSWHLFDVSRLLKPFIYQSRRSVRFESFTSSRDLVVFDNNKYVWGGDARYNVGVSLWQLAFKGVA
jgi:phage major head subunit gpT-like protein